MILDETYLRTTPYAYPLTYLQDDCFREGLDPSENPSFLACKRQPASHRIGDERRPISRKVPWKTREGDFFCERKEVTARRQPFYSMDDSRNQIKDREEKR
jgi:hypothetical protein